MKPFPWLALLLLLAPCLAPGQTTPPPSDAPDKQTDYNKIVDHFFEAVQSGRYTAAAHVLVDTNAADEFNVDKHESLANPLQQIADKLGTFKTFKPIVNKTLGDGIGYVYGIAIYDRSPLRYEFMFYKDGAYWRLLHIDFNLNYVPEVRDLAGIHVPAPPVIVPAPAAPPAAAPAAKPKSPDNPEPPAAPVPSSSEPTLTNPPATAPAPAPTPATLPVPAPTPAPSSTSPATPSATNSAPSQKNP
jgi:hypothetical protein